MFCQFDGAAEEILAEKNAKTAFFNFFL